MSWVCKIFSTDPCCGCVRLWLATTIVSGIEIILSTTATITYILSLATINMYKTEKSLRASGLATFLNFWSVDGKEGMKNIDGIKSRLWITFGLALFFSVVTLAVASILLYGVQKKNITLVKGCILFKAFGISLCIIYLLTTIILGQATAIGIFLDLTEIGVLSYFLWIVYAFMKELVEKQVLRMSPSIIQTQGKIEVSFPL